MKESGLMLYFRGRKKVPVSIVLTILFCISVLIPSGLDLETSADDSGTKLVAITFDDGPGLYTSDLIDRLNERNVKATFFIVGQNAEYYPDVLQKAADSGHELGNHSYDHPVLTDYDIDSIAEEINTTNSILEKADGKSTHLLRPPYGEFNDDVAACAGAPMIYWSVDTNDWSTLDTDAVYNAIMDGVYDGAIILLHDVYETTCDGAVMAIDDLKAQGWEFCTVSELFEREGIEMQDGVMYYNASPDTDAHIYGEVDENGVYSIDEGVTESQDQQSDEAEEYIIEDMSIRKDTYIYSDTEAKTISGLLSKGSEIHLYDTPSGNCTKISTDSGIIGYIPDSELDKLRGSWSGGSDDADASGGGVTRLSSGVIKLYADDSLFTVRRILNSDQELTVVSSQDGVSIVRLSDGTAGYILSSGLRNYYSTPVKSAVLDFGDSGMLVADVNLRNEPSADAAIKGVITYGAQVDIIGRNGSWLEISYAGYSGFVRDYTVSRDDSSCFVKASVTEKCTLYSSEGSGKIGTVKAGSVHILSEPGDYTLILTSSGSVGYVSTENLEY